ncbi:hypothetical protein BISA_1600 [Bifidobacterium saguini DSM 23967]|uniref:Uncharacterized protein n=2 Tax=Bifidobacterium saguini TaxID=762210 RepID=A0A087DDB2_9BIFI|nr:hypothetical protein [Bifidobacterium saguini]KFI93512.1 hypothetical protein BISA_1600 [Bifidobacterium saguini DSM 23967]QTB90693.1 hypothetical protein BSD967_10425 [Bifidobacterium saguini]
MSDSIKPFRTVHVLCAKDTQGIPAKLFENSPSPSGRVADAAAWSEVGYWAGEAARYRRVGVGLEWSAAVCASGSLASLCLSVFPVAVLLIAVSAVCAFGCFRASVEEDAALTFRDWSMPTVAGAGEE